MPSANKDSVFVKICGITTEDDALLAVAMGADAVGFVFAPSPRQVNARNVADIIKRLPDDVLKVGVFRDEVPSRVIRIAHEVGLDCVQLHGHETAEDAGEVRARVGKIICAFPAGSDIVKRADEFPCDYVMLDNPNPGSGTVFDWQLADAVPLGMKLILAGGLTPDNVADAVIATNAFGVDVSSGVESSPGVKDPLKVQRFVAAAKSVMPDERVSVADSDNAPYDWMEEGSS